MSALPDTSRQLKEKKKKGAEPVLEEKVWNVVYWGFNKVFDIVSHSVLIAILVISGLKM